MLKPIPDADKIKIKEEFISHYKKFCPNYDEFMKYSLSFLRRSFRVNTLKIDIARCRKRLEKQGWILEQIPWCKEGFWVDHIEGRRDIGNTIEHALGYIYVQEAASMIPPIALNPKEGEIILDMCAAPGSKTTQMAAMMKNKGMIVANDLNADRIKALGINIQRTGAMNVMTTIMRGQGFKNHSFDKILLDAPCSGTGTIRSSLGTLKMWNLTGIRRLTGFQRQLLDTSFANLKEGGEIVYSTCSVEPLENEIVIDSFIKNNKKEV
ncbi:MAG: RsmB/NOP family class I SAM-dependent RNA methyltransferase, partial [Candidatus Woesearchaeota archaeon]